MKKAKPSLKNFEVSDEVMKIIQNAKKPIELQMVFTDEFQITIQLGRRAYTLSKTGVQILA